MFSEYLECVGNIPAELKQLDQWCFCANGDKRPLNPNTGFEASPTDPRTWGSFSEAFAAAEYTKGAIGFVLTEQAGFGVIDLDNKVDNPASIEELELYASIMNGAKSYVEHSLSGRGFHIIVRGSNSNGRWQKVEFYTSQRFMILTGDLHKDYCWSSISNGQVILDRLVNLRGASGKSSKEVLEFTWRPERSDEDVLDQLARDNDWAYSGLYLQGNLSRHLNDHSRADQALVGHLLPLCSSAEQLWRIFHSSKLERPKAHQLLYRSLTLNSSIKTLMERREQEAKTTQMLMGLNLVPVVQAPPAEIEAEEVEEPPLQVEPSDLPPSGLQNAWRPWEENLDGWMDSLMPPALKYIADRFNDIMIQGIREFAVANTLATIAGVAGRKYCTFFKNGGLNLYIILVGESGVGKTESAESTLVPTLHDAFPARVGVPQGHPMGMDLWVSTPGKYIYPSLAASGQGFLSLLKPEKNLHQPGGIMFWDEIVEELIGPLGQKNPPPHVLSLKSRILKLHGASKNSGVLMGNSRSNKEMSVSSFWSPAVTILGAAPTDRFWPSVEGISYNDGFLSRILIIERTAKVPHMDPTKVSKPFSADPWIRDLLVSIDCGVERISIETGKIPCQAESDVLRSVYAFHGYILDKMFALKDNPKVAHLWVRLFEHAIRLSCLAAIADNPAVPIVRPVHWKWAIAFVMHCKKTLESKLDGGFGTSESSKEYIQTLKKLLKSFDRPCKEWSKEAREKGLITPSVIGVMHLLPTDLNMKNSVKRQLLEDGIFLQVSLEETRKVEGMQRATKAGFLVDKNLLRNLIKY